MHTQSSGSMSTLVRKPEPLEAGDDRRAEPALDVEHELVVGQLGHPQVGVDAAPAG